MYEFFIARRYLRATRQIPLVTLISVIAALGVTVGVAAMICSLAVFNGFDGIVRSLLIGFDPHVRVEGVNRQPLADYHKVLQIINALPDVKAASAFVEGRVAVVNRNTVMVVNLRGADSHFAEATGLPSHIVGGKYDVGGGVDNADDAADVDDAATQLGAVDSTALREQSKYDYSKNELPGIVLGILLADRLGVTLGDTITMVSPAGIEQTLTQFAQPLTVRFRVSGVFTSIPDYDLHTAFSALKPAQRLCAVNGVDGVEIRLDDINKSDEVKHALEQSLAAAGIHTETVTWYDLHRDLFSVMEIERWVAYLILSLIIAVAAFTILGSLTMTVIEKHRDIALLKAAGATDASVQKIFLMAGALIGIIGVVCGSIIGFAACRAQQIFGIFTLDSTVYRLNALPVEMRVSDFVVVGLAGLILCTLAAVYPAKRAARVVPAEALRWE